MRIRYLAVVPRHQHLMGMLCLALAFGWPRVRAAELDEIVRRATAVLKADWAADSDYAYIERDQTANPGKPPTSKTSRVVMMAGSDYYLPLATNDEPLSTQRKQVELQKLKQEWIRRSNESGTENRRRIAEYQRARDENQALVLDFPHAFRYELVGEEIINGSAAYVLSATPLKRTGPLSRAARVLGGMTGTVWIEKSTFHTAKAKCTVASPVPIYGILARVMPGTRIELSMAPVTESVWLIDRLAMSLNVSKFFFLRSTQNTISTYTNYRLNSAELEELLAQTQ